MYIDSGKDLTVDKIQSPRPDRLGPNANKRTQVPVKQSTKLKASQVAMKSTGSVTANGEKYA
jgi:hypothetical protein